MGKFWIFGGGVGGCFLAINLSGYEVFGTNRDYEAPGGVAGGGNG